MFKFALLTLVILSSTPVHALTQEETTITIYQTKSASKVIDVAKLPSKELLSRTPHRALNPEKKLIKFKGADLNAVIKLA